MILLVVKILKGLINYILYGGKLWRVLTLENLMAIIQLPILQLWMFYEMLGAL